MKLKDIPTLSDYLETKCYCRGEIYSCGGFFYQIFKGEDNCELLCERHDDKFNFKAVLANSSANSEVQILTLWFKDNSIFDVVRYDATKNNIKIFKMIANNIEIPTETYFDEFNAGEKEKSLKQIMDMSSGVIVS